MSNPIQTSKLSNYVKQITRRKVNYGAGEMGRPRAIDENLLCNLPKVELHAHLNGSLSSNTMHKLSELKHGPNGVNLNEYQLLNSINIHEAFKKFKLAHDLTDTIAAVSLATKCVIEDFAADNVVYLELRTTPRQTSHMTKDEYITAVIEAIKQSKISQPKILVKLIFSINRREDLREAEENVKLLLKYRALHPTIVCGMDLSGDPACKTFADFKHLLAQVKEAGVKLALHCGEIENASEIGEMLDFGFDRLGHGTFVCEENQLKLLQNKSIAVECCLTSNVLSQTVPNFSAHHFRDYFDRGHPVVICTDDFGVFNTSLSKELSIAANTFGLTLDDIVRLQQTAINCSFASPEEKQSLLTTVAAFVK